MKNSNVLKVRDLHNSDIKSKFGQIIDALIVISDTHNLHHSTDGSSNYILKLNVEGSFSSIESFDDYSDFISKCTECDFNGFSFYAMSFRPDGSFSFFSTHC